MTCLACDLTSGRAALPGGLVHETGTWRVEHCIGPLGVGTLVVKPTRHVTHLADLNVAEHAELGPLLRRTAEVVAGLVEAEQVYACLWSHAGRVPGHLHFVVEPATAEMIDAHGGACGPALQVAQFARGEQPDADAVEAFCRRAEAAFAGPGVPGGLLSVSHSEGAAAFLAALRAFVDGVAGTDDARLLAPSRCMGWSALDVVAHVHLGLQEMLTGVVSPSDAAPDVDAATYWRTFPPGTDDASADDLDGVLFVRRLASAYRRPAGLARHLDDTARGLARAVETLPEGAVAFQGHVLSTGDFLATWAVELAVHHLDIHGDPDPSALALARRTVEALAGATASGVDDTTLVLAGAGRIPPDGLTGLPVLG